MSIRFIVSHLSLTALALGLAAVGCSSNLVPGGGSENCQQAACGTKSYQACTTSSAGGCASARYVMADGTAFACNGCDCNAAAAQVQQACATGGGAGNSSLPNPAAGQAKETCQTTQQCGAGKQLEVCTTTDSHSACVSVAYKVGGATYACATCDNCTDASKSASQSCTGGSAGSAGTAGTAGGTAGTPGGSAGSAGTPGGSAGTPGGSAGSAGTAGTAGTPGGSAGTPGGGQTCSGMIDTGSPACNTCVEGQCCTELTACFGNQACTDLLDCLNACGQGDQTCEQTCAQQHQAGVTDLNALGGCFQTTCGTSCQ